MFGIELAAEYEYKFSSAKASGPPRHDIYAYIYMICSQKPRSFTLICCCKKVVSYSYVSTTMLARKEAFVDRVRCARGV